jgi:hypothetical protein
MPRKAGRNRETGAPFFGSMPANGKTSAVPATVIQPIGLVDKPGRHPEMSFSPRG